MGYAGFYINLDRSHERRAEIEDELKRNHLELNYQRFSAVEGRPEQLPPSRLKDGEIGCFSSHHKLIKENLFKDQHLHIIEDDVVFSPHTEKVIHWAIETGKLAQYDILYTDVAVPLLNDAYKAYKKFFDTTVTHDAQGAISKVSFSVIDLHDLMFASTSSFVINKASLKKLNDLYEQELMAGATLPIDLFIRKKCQEGVIRVGCLLPFVTSVRLEHTLKTSIDQRHNAVSVLAANMARYSFFVGCDWNKCHQYMKEYLPLPTQLNQHAELLNHLLSFSMTDAYQSY